MNDKIKEITLKSTDSIKQAMGIIDHTGLGIAFIVNDNNRFMGMVTDGDIRRAILKGINIDKVPIDQIMNRDAIIFKSDWSTKTINSYIQNQSNKVHTRIPKHGSMKVPVVDENGQIVDMLCLTKKSYEEAKEPIIKIEHDVANVGAVNNILIIGGAGYLGSILCRKLLDRGYKVRVLDNLMYGDFGIRALRSHPMFEFIEGDMRNLQIVTECMKGIDAVVHLAAIVGDPASALDPEKTIEINYLSTKIVAEVCKYYQINRFIFASTCSVYGDSPTPYTRITEESHLNPVSLYAEMKLKSEKGILELIDENFSPTILRMATLYGLAPRMRFDLVVNLLTAKALTEGKITIFGGDQWRPNLHVSDAAEAYIKCLEAPINKIKGEIFNVGSNSQNYQIKELGEIINSVVPEAEVLIDEEQIDRRDYNVSFDKISDVLDYAIEYTVKEGAIEMRDALLNKIITDYTEERYSNYKFLHNTE